MEMFTKIYRFIKKKYIFSWYFASFIATSHRWTTIRFWHQWPLTIDSQFYQRQLSVLERPQCLWLICLLWTIARQQLVIGIYPKTFFSDKVAPPTPIKPKYCQEASKTEFTTLTPPPAHVILSFYLVKWKLTRYFCSWGSKAVKSSSFLSST